MKADVGGADLVVAVRRGDVAPAMERMRVVARSYAGLGLRVLPLWHVFDDGSCACRNPEHAPGGKDAGRAGKHPRNSGGVSSASHDPQVIDSWWVRWPNAGIAIATGYGIDVIDVDRQSAVQDIADLMAAGRLSNALAWANSGRAGGGLHVIVPSRPGATNAQSLLPGVDYRGEGGYFVVAPTRHQSLRTYEWLFDDPLPRGDRSRGQALSVTLPWERAVPGRTAVGKREGAYAAARLVGRVGDVRAAESGLRNKAVYDAAYAMGPYVQQGWISRARVEQGLLSAYEEAGGQGAGTSRTIANGLANSAHLTIRPLVQSEGHDVGAVLRWIRRWSRSAAGRKGLTGSRRVVLEWFSQQAHRRQSLTMRASQREVAVDINRSRTAVGRAIKGLGGLGLLETVMAGSTIGGEAAVYRLCPPPGFSQSGPKVTAKPPVPLGDVSHLEKNAAVDVVVPAQPLSVIGHSLWSGGGRGEGHGLTHIDRQLLAALPTDQARIKMARWVRDAAVSQASAYRAADPTIRGSLAALGLVLRERGLIRATDAGAHAAQAVQGKASLDALDALAVRLGVAGRADRRADQMAAERDSHERALLTPATIRALLGREGRRRDARRFSNLLEPISLEALNRLFWELDLPDEGPDVRRPLTRIVTAAVAFAEGGQRPRAEDMSAAGVPGDALERFMAPVWVGCRRVSDMAAVVAGLRLAEVPPTGRVDPATGARLSASEAEALEADGGPVLTAHVPVSDADWAKAHVAAEFFINPAPAIADVMGAIAERTTAMPQRLEPSPGYAPYLGAR